MSYEISSDEDDNVSIESDHGEPLTGGGQRKAYGAVGKPQQQGFGNSLNNSGMSTTMGDSYANISLGGTTGLGNSGLGHSGIGSPGQYR